MGDGRAAVPCGHWLCRRQEWQLEMKLDSHTQAVVLLTVSFGTPEGSTAKPLSPKEWSRLAAWLRDRKLDASALLKGDLKNELSGWMDRSITLSRLESLLDRGGAFGLSLERWQRTGLWIVTQSDPEYPGQLKRRLRLDSPLAPAGNCHILPMRSRTGPVIETPALHVARRRRSNSLPRITL